MTTATEPAGILHQVAALDGDGKSSVWHVVAPDYKSARKQVADEISESTLKKPVVVLAIVPKGNIV